MKIDFSKPITTPILFMVFNRPDKTRRVFEAIRAVKPLKLYVAVDHPRNGRDDDEKNCLEVKSIVTNVDWPCETHYLFHPENRGCSLAGKLAWDWFFEQEEEMIFIEDDGLANASFFHYADILLGKYREDERVAYIGGVNYGPKFGNATYFFSRLPSATYAMATWKRVYTHFEYDLKSYLTVGRTKEFRGHFPDKLAYYWNQDDCMSYIRYHRNSYDIQMVYLVHKYGMYSISPNVNMVANIGLDGGANNCCSTDSNEYRRLANRPCFELDEIRYPQDVFLDEEFEREYFKVRVLGGRSRIWGWWNFLVVRKFRRFASHLLRRTGLKKIAK